MSPQSIVDDEVRSAALAAIELATKASGGVVNREQMTAGFTCNGRRIPFANEMKGIWKPALLGRDGAALTLTTASVPKGGTPRYDDQVASEDGCFYYKYQDAHPDNADNQAVRRAMERRLPLIYFYGIAPGRYEAIHPVFIERDDRAEHRFQVVAGSRDLGDGGIVELADMAIFKRYATVIVKRRLHQRRFREAVVRAYRTQCSVCHLRHEELIDAAHILADKDVRGNPEVPNGLALCKIHHGAFDANILGISPDRRIHIRSDILSEVDGPMLEHGLQRMNGQPISVPVRTMLRPKAEYLEERFARFLAA